MSKPTPLSPWFVVMRLVHLSPDVMVGAPAELSHVEWYTEADGEADWSKDRTQARLFNSVHSAARVAYGGGGYAIALVDEEALKEFRPKGL